MTINYDMLETMSDKFIPESISSRIVSINQDFEKRERYGADLNTSNDENNLHHMLGIAGI